MDPGVGSGIALGVLQGLTEFLPVSSSGHLALGQLLFGVSEGSLTTNVLLHAGTLLATILVLRRPVGRAARDGLRSLRKPSSVSSTPGGRDALVVIVASIPTGLAGLLLRDAVERWSRSPVVIGLGFVLTAGVLVSTRLAPPGKESHPTALGSLILGAVQAVALLPGVSRSGATIAAALWLGVAPSRAFELSMLISLPAIAGATLLELPHAWREDVGLAAALSGATVAFLVGVAALRLLRGVVTRGHLALFALWIVPLAIATFAYAHALP